MSQSRLAVIDLAFKKLDKTGDGVITVDDMKGIYNAERHPQFISGEKTREEVFAQFLKNFEVGGHVDGKVSLPAYLKKKIVRQDKPLTFMGR
uniref:EF-hand domain-containing protein n=1 Tax=Ascaris lumbricoides TaxID=6252 RepID=A0A0M3HLF4_ASCLU